MRWRRLAWLGALAACAPAADPAPAPAPAFAPAPADAVVDDALAPPGLVVPSSLGPLSAQVGETASAPLAIINGSPAAVAIALAFPGGTPGSDWSADQCVAPESCEIAPGDTLEVTVTFTPSAHGRRDATLEVDATPDAGPRFVTMLGTGLGGVLRVDAPAQFTHDFGTLAKDQVATLVVEMSNRGNEAIEVTPSELPAPFVVDPTARTLDADGGAAAFEVRCGPAAPGGPFTGVIDLVTSPNTYAQNTSTITVTCAIANTTLEVAPNPIDFGELRVGGAPGAVEVTLTNPPDGDGDGGGGAAIEIDRIALVGAPDALTRGPTSLELPATLGDGETLTTTLALATTDELALDGVTLEIELVEVEPVVLALPVTGKIGTPRAAVQPGKLALGTVCVGTPVRGEIALTNTGTVTLVARRPAITAVGFDLGLESPTSYPEPPDGVALAPTDSALVSLAPSVTDVAGLLETTLEWDVDLPLAPFHVPVTLQYLASGTAVSPAEISFGPLDVGAVSTTQLVTLENCGTTDAVVTYDGVRATTGGAAAWQLDPPADRRTLPPDGTMRILVAFAPTTPGDHRATIAIEVDGAAQEVQLDGTALGALADQTSFYACDCSGGGAPARGWPIVLAIAIAITARRRGSS